MNKTTIVTAVVSLIIGILLAITGYFVYIVVHMRSQVNQNTDAINQIVNFINSNIQAQQAAATAKK